MCAAPVSPSMTTMHSRSRLRRSASASLRLGLATALSLCAALPFAAAAHAAPTLLLPAGAGVTEPGGIAETTDGSVWIADGALGICRVQTTAPAGLVPSPYCAPEPVDAVPPPPARPGPSAAFQMAFDPISQNFFVAEGSSKGAGIWRMHWNEADNAIDAAEPVVFAGENRVFALALGTNPDTSVYVDFNGRDDTTIHRLEDAANATPVSISATPVVGFSQNPGVASMTNLDGALYLAEGTGVTRIAAPATTAPTAISVAGFPAGTGAVPSTVAADPALHRVYAGTGNPDGIDRIDVLSTGDVVSTYETGFSLVTALGVRAGGNLLVGDDPAAGAGANGPVGQGRIAEVGLQDANLPAVAITSGPDIYSSQTAASFAFSSTDGAAFACKLDGAAWTPCDDAAGPDGAQAYAGIGDGVHVFEVRAADVGRAARYTFAVDTAAPSAQVDNPAADKVIERDALRARFSSDEFGVTYACELDGAYVHGCVPPVWLRGFALGTHTFTVTPTDLAGNVGETVAWTFKRIAPPPAPPRPDNSGPGSAPGPDNSGPGSAAAVEQTSSASSVVPKACRTIAGQKKKGSYTLAGRLLTVRITPTKGAGFAKLTLRPRGKAKGTVVKVAVKAVSGTQARNVRVTLSKAQAARLRSRSTMLTVGYGTCAETIGAQTELTKAAAR